MRIRPAFLAAIVKRCLRIRRVVVETAFGRFWVDPISDFGVGIIENGDYEPEMRAILTRYLGPGKVFVDLGANEGYFTILGAKLTTPGGRVVAIEPQDRLMAVMSKNLNLNSVEATIVHAAISDRRMTGVLHLSPDTNSGSTTLQQVTKYSVQLQLVNIFTLTEVLSQTDIRNIDLLKVDIEGFEHEAIFGSPELFTEKRIGAVALELHPKALKSRGKSAGDLVSFLEHAGYVRVHEFEQTVWVLDSAHLSNP